MCAIVIIYTFFTLHIGTSLASPQIYTKLFRTPPVVGATIYTKLFQTPPVVGATISKPNADLEDHVAPTNATVDCNPTCQRGTCNGPNECSCTTSWSSDRCNKEFYGASSGGELSFIKGELSRVSSSGLRLNWRNKDYRGYTALHIAAKNDHAPVVRVLLEAGANPDMKGEAFGMTPMYLAAGLGRTAVLRTLLEPKYRADVNLQDNDGVTPVYMAAGTGQTAALEVLIAHGADVNTVNNYGQSPLSSASLSGRVAVVRALITAGANIGYVRPSDGRTALHWAARFNHADVARLLLQHGADKRIQDKDGDTPADLSRQSGDGSVARIIDNY